MIPVTKPYLPQMQKYMRYVEEIYNRGWLTNNGPLVQAFEKNVKNYLELDNLYYVANGTLALQLAIRALRISGEVITTPFSYVATTSSIVWEGCTPVFVDIDKNTLNIDSAKIEAAITDQTSAILATHCFGNACDIEAIGLIASKHNLKVIYDAAHCFGTKYKGKSIFSYGDISVTSLHATKLMHSIEGGLLFTIHEELSNRISFLRNFGHDGYEKFNGIGINAKNSEFHAAMGLCVLEDIDRILRSRQESSLYYDALLDNVPLKRQVIGIHCDYNYAYYPVIFDTEERLLQVKEKLEKSFIYPRRYFYPSLNLLDYVNQVEMLDSESISKRILCLPLYEGIIKEDIMKIVEIIKNELV